ncbi:MAG: hypothetical protein WA954_12015 [Parerythrobacter sp.]
MQPGQGANVTSDGTGVDESWDSIRADGSIQYAELDIAPREMREPGWVDAFFRFLGDILEPIGQLFGAAWPVVQVVLIATAMLMALLLLYRLLAPIFAARVVLEGDTPDDWTPARAEALALLSDADRLADAGQFDEATHMLLQRSVAQIGSARPSWVEPSSTARELAGLAALPDAARRTFSIIAERVERSMFALKPLARSDWETARRAYAEFALQSLDSSGEKR